MKEILKINNLIKKFPKTGGEIDDEDAISESWESPAVVRRHF